jgi:hypothetical protein
VEDKMDLNDKIKVWQKKQKIKMEREENSQLKVNHSFNINTSTNIMKRMTSPL